MDTPPQGPQFQTEGKSAVIQQDSSVTWYQDEDHEYDGTVIEVLDDRARVEFEELGEQTVPLDELEEN